MWRRIEVQQPLKLGTNICRAPKRQKWVKESELM